MNSALSQKLKILISAYACEPNKGSEPEVGWRWSKEIVKFAEVWVITRENNKEVIEEELKKRPDPNIHFIYIDLPKWMRFWKKGSRGARTYYYLWQIAALRQAKRFQRSIKFDIVQHVTFVNDWLPSFMAFLSVPLIWGPIGSHPPFPKHFQPKFRSILLENARLLIQNFFRHCDPFFYITLIKAKKIIMINRNIAKKYPFTLLKSDKIIFQPAIAIDYKLDTKTPINKRDNISIISVGRLIYIKGFHLTLKVFSVICKKIPNIKLKIIGEGPERNYLEKLASEEGIKERVIFLGNVKRDAVYDEMKESDLFLFPSFEGGGMVVLEAMSLGLPVICLDYGGPGEMVTDECGIKVKPVNLEQTINDLSGALLKLANDPALRKRMGEAGQSRVKDFYSWNKRGKFIEQVYKSIIYH